MFRVNVIYKDGRPEESFSFTEERYARDFAQLCQMQPEIKEFKVIGNNK